MKQQTLFETKRIELPDWKKEKEEGMRRAEKHARPAWKEAAIKTIEQFARTHSTFSGWEITMLLRKAELNTRTERALGPLLVAAAKQGLIEKTDEHRNNPLAHGCPSPVWKSLVYIPTNERNNEA